MPVCAWADAVQQEDLVQVPGKGSFCHKLPQGPMERSPHSVLCVFFKISSHIRLLSSCLGRFCLGYFFRAGTPFMQTLEVTYRASSGIVLKMESMAFSGTVEQKCQLLLKLVWLFGLDYKDELYASL